MISDCYTLKNPPLAGKEPDTSYSFETRKNSPDLAVEVIFTSGDLNEDTGAESHSAPRDVRDSLTKYKYLNIEEVWFWKDNKIKFYHLVDNDYIESDRSKFLSKLTPEFLVKFVNRSLTESPLTIEADFTSELN